ncbi:MAG: DNA-binding protein [Campylobacterota bacterium]|nr:DNA-binding protein [Campylobacterota bacterium]
MSKMTVAEAAVHFNVSKEAIHNRIRRGSIDCVIENGVKYVVTIEAKPVKTTSDSRYYEYIEKENERLKNKVDKLEDETRGLRVQREKMLIEEREKIETIYKERDEQLKNVLQVVATKFLANMNVENMIEDAVTAEVIEKEESLVSLKDFLKLKAYKEKKREKIKKRFKATAKKDSRITLKKGKLYLNLEKYDYSDML